jgi:hypothetical protein
LRTSYLKKPSFRPSKWPRKLKPAKNSKLPKLPENCFEPVGKGGWPPISTWIKYVARGFSQIEGVDYDENFSPVAQYTSIYSIISLIASMG